MRLPPHRIRRVPFCATTLGERRPTLGPRALRRMTRQHLADLRSLPPQIAPSLLMCDFGNLASEVERLEAADVRVLHLDVMDGHFVPNLTYGMPIVAGLRRLTRLPLDVHLMISNPGDYVEQFVEAGADTIMFHIEAVSQPRPILEKIRALGVGAGLALNPATPLSAIEEHLDLCDQVLVMSVQAGFGGQSFQKVALEKLRALRSKVSPDVLLEVDGGVNESTIQDCAEAGAHLLVVGSAIFKHNDYAAAMRRLTGLMEPQARVN
jgi:ribulose-phosphate 3-epimerase